MEKDFIIKEKEDYYKTIFRFIPEDTHVHGFDDNPPKDWKSVYKVYYSWQILMKYLEDDTEEVLLEFVCDECSTIPNLPEIIKNVMETGETFDCPTFGQPAADWMIRKRTGIEASYDKIDNKIHEKPYEIYDFYVFHNCTGQGFMFTFNKEETLKFCEYLKEINQYALEHSEGI